MRRWGPEVVAWLKGLFADPRNHIVFHNAKFDLGFIMVAGVDVLGAPASIHCTLSAAKLYNSMLHSYELRDLGPRYLRRVHPDAKDAVDVWLKENSREFTRDHGRKPNFSDVPWSIIKGRALWDTETTLKLFQLFYPHLQKTCPSLYATENTLIRVCVDMESTGVKVDISRARRLKSDAEVGAAIIQKQLDELICPLTVQKKKTRKRKGEKFVEYIDLVLETFNVGSTAIQVPAAFTKLGIPLRFKTQPKKGRKGKASSGGGNWAFDEYAMIRYVSPALQAVIRESSEEGWGFKRWWDAVYDAIKDNDLPKREWLPPLILKLRELRKMVSTYYDHIINDAVDVHFEPSGREVGRLHCRFNQSEAKTGRFSSSGPNLQNMPRILGPRECFIPEKGRRNWHFDYAQVEVKFFVHFSRDEKMAEAMRQGLDIHQTVGAEIYHVPFSEVTKEQRKRAKGIVFGITYGAGGPKISVTLTSKGLPTSKSEACHLVAAFHRKHPSVRRLTNELKAQLHRKGYIESPSGRRYYIDKQKAYTAINYLCQGYAADVIKAAMARIWLWLREARLKTKMIITVHDELVFSVPRSEEALVYAQVTRLMEDHKSYMLPITVEADVCPKRWSKKVDPTTLGFTKEAA